MSPRPHDGRRRALTRRSVIASKARRRGVLAPRLEGLEDRALLAGTPEMVPGQVLVRFKDGVSPFLKANALSRLELTGPVREAQSLNPAPDSGTTDDIRRVYLPQGMSVAEGIDLLKNAPAVDAVEPNWIYTTDDVSNDTHYTNGNLWGAYGNLTSPANNFGSGAGELWNAGYTGSSTVYIGVIDEGIQFDHPDLAANMWLNPFETAGNGIDDDGNGYKDDMRGWDFFNNDASVYDGTADDHGTHVAGTIGAVGGNGAGIAGMAWNVKMISAKFLGPGGGDTGGAIAAINYFIDLKSRHNLNIVALSNSWGGGGYSPQLGQAIIRAAKANMLFVASAGNGGADDIGDNNDTTPAWPSNYDSTQTIGAETGASYDSVIAVAAIANNGLLGGFSNFGAVSVDLGAPGVGIVSTIPGSGYAAYNGTSMATPHVTGAIALYAAANPGATPAEIRTKLLSSTVPTSSLTGKTVTGGRLDVSFIDTNTPSVVSINRLDPDPTGANSVRFTVTFSEPVVGVNTTDFALSTTGTIAGASVTTVTGSGTTYTVTINTGTGDGTIRLDLNDDDSITDAANNKLGGNGAGNGSFATGQFYTLLRVAPTVVSLVRLDPNPANTATVRYTATFSIAVTGVDTGDFTLSTSGLAGASIASVTGSGATRTITVNTGTGSGTLRVDLTDNDTIVNGGLPLGGAGGGNGNFTGETYTIDKAVPTVSSIVRAAASPTNAASVAYTVTFGESVTGVNAADFGLSTTGVAGASITNVSGSGATYTVTVNTGTGSGTIRLDLIDDDSITDAANNKLGGNGAGNGNFSTGQVYTVDRTPPTATSITRLDPSPTNAASVRFAVVFSETVAPVVAGDFLLDIAGAIGGASITSVTGSGANYTVTVNTGFNDGAIHLSLIDQDTILDLTGNPLGGVGAGNGNNTNGQTYFIDKTPPVVASSNRVDPDPTGADSVNFLVNFSDLVSAPVAADFALTTTGALSGVAVTGISGTGSLYTVTVSTVTGDGTLRLDVVDRDTILDMAGNKLGGDGLGNANFTTGQFYTITHGAPTVASIARLDPHPSNAGSVRFNVLFSSDVTGVDATDFALVTGAPLTGASITGVTGSGFNYTVTVNTGSGDGTIRLDVIDDDSIIGVFGGQPLGNAGVGNANFTSGPAYTVDKTLPTVSTIVRLDSDPSNASTIRYNVAFSENVSGVNIGDFTLTTTGVSGASITGVTGGSMTYTVTIATGTGDGTIRLNLVDDDSIGDAANNKLGGTGAGNGSVNGPVYAIIKSPPTVTSIALVGASPTNAALVDFLVTFNRSVTAVDATDFTLTTTGGITGAGIVSSNGSGTTYTVTIATGSGDGTIKLNLIDDDTIFDAAFNKLGGTGNANGNFTTGPAYTLDRTAPTVSSVAKLDPDPTNLAAVRYRITLSEAVPAFGLGNLQLDAGAGITGAALQTISGGPTIYTVTIGTGTGDGPLGLTVQNTVGAADAAGNSLTGLPVVGAPYTLDRTAPQVQAIVLKDPNPTKAASVVFGVQFTESVTGLSAANFQLVTSGTIAGASIASVSLVGGEWRVTVNTGSGDGSIQLRHVNSTGAADAAGNPIAGLPFDGPAYALDRTAPRVQAIVLKDPSPSNASSVRFGVRFTESDVAGLTPTNFQLVTVGTLSGVSIGSVALVDGEWTVTVNTGSGNGSIQLRMINGVGVADAVGNALTGLPFFGSTYTIDRTAPRLQTLTSNGTSPTNTSTLTYTATFTEAIVGLTADHFSLATTGGITGAAVTGLSGGPTVYTVTVSTGSGDGTVQLRLAAPGTLADPAGNALTGTPVDGPAFTIDKTAPAVTELAKLDADPSNKSTVRYRITLSEPAAGFGLTNLRLDTGPGLTGTAFQSFTGGPTVFTVTLKTGGGSGSLGLTVLTSTGATDTAGNAIAALPASAAPYTLDRALPMVQTITPLDPAFTSASTVRYVVQLSEGNVTGLTATNFQVLTTGTITGASIGSVALVGSEWIVTVNTGGGDGTVQLRMVNGTGVADPAGNTLTGLPASGPAYTLDRTLPTLASLTAGQANPTNASTLNYTATFSEAVTGVSLADFRLAATGVSGAAITGLSGGPTLYIITVDTGSGDGTIQLRFEPTGTIADAVANALPSSVVNGPTFVLDRTTPTVSIDPVLPDPIYTGISALRIAFSEPVVGLNLTHLKLSVNGGPNLITAAQTLTTTDNTSFLLNNLAAITGAASGTYTLQLVAPGSGITDRATNPLIQGASRSWTVDVSQPKVVGMALGWGAAGRADVSTGSNPVLPWAGINRIDVRFSKDVRVDLSYFQLRGLTIGNYLVGATLSYNATTRTATLRLAQTIGIDRVTLKIAGTGPVGVNDGYRYMAGGDFTWTARVLPGDFDGDGLVTQTDANRIRALAMGSLTPSSNVWADLNGDGSVDLRDYDLVRQRVGTRLPS